MVGTIRSDRMVTRNRGRKTGIEQEGTERNRKGICSNSGQSLCRYDKTGRLSQWNSVTVLWCNQTWTGTTGTLETATGCRDNIQCIYGDAQPTALDTPMASPFG